MSTTTHAPTGSRPLPLPAGPRTAFAVQARLLWTSRRPLILAAGLAAALLGAGWIPGPLPRLLEAWPVWLYLVGPLWALGVWHGEPPSGRHYMWSQPVDRVTHSLARVAAGLAFLWLGLAAVGAGGVGAAALEGGLEPLRGVSLAGWVNLLTAPLVGYLFVSAIAVASDYPLRWLFGVVLVPPLLLGALEAVLDVALVDVAGRIGPWLPFGTLAGPLARDAGRIAVALAGQDAGRFRVVLDEPVWWASTALWTVLCSALVAGLSCVHPDRFRIPLRRAARSRGVGVAFAVSGTAAVGLALAVVVGLGGTDATARDDGDGGAAVKVRDSSAVEIVTNTGEGLRGPGETWTIERVVRFGGGAGGEEPLGAVAGLDVDSRGRIHVLDRHARRVRVFDSAGAPVASLGRPGRGPGEIGPAPSALFVGPGDTVTVIDPSLRRAVRLTPQGGVAGSWPLDRVGAPVRWAETPEGELMEQLLVPPDPGGERAPGNLLQRRSPAGAVEDTVLELSASGPYSFNGGVPRLTLFAPEPLWTVDSHGGLVTAHSDRLAYEVRDPSGSLVRVVRAPSVPKAVTEEDRDRLRASLVEGMKRDGLPESEARRLGETVRFAESYPAMARLLGGPDGTVWVQRVRVPEELDVRPGDGAVDVGSPEWDVFGAGGRRLGAVTLPPGFTPLLFRGERLYGVETDELGVQRVMVLRLRR